MSMHACPRCLGTAIRTEYEGREDGTTVWSILYCGTCSFSWRTSEPPSTIDPLVRNPDFRIDASDLDRFPVVLAPARSGAAGRPAATPAAAHAPRKPSGKQRA
jgi:hypothetical protein